MGRQLSNISDEATQMQNTPGEMTPILELQPEDGLTWLISPNVARGNEPGIPIFGGFYDSNGDPLPQDTKVALQFEAPNDDDRQTVTEPYRHIRDYLTLDLKDQQNEEYIDAIKHILKGRQLVVEDIDTLYVSIQSSAQMDWSQVGSRVTISENAVQEV
ncbi:hypothetical protein ACFR9U_17175 [Halorientalis brevis]|uniref:Uncharacterized protein n=1 Tax=Halorientalis brevis TaxID=1126241 RepID=A0ABD6CH17_9EURY|nr:hypothetical protein [Halorientalis brevis]